MKITILTLFPEMFESYLNNSIIKRAQAKGLVEFELINIRDFTMHKNHRVDDYPTGGGAGLIMQCQPVLDALKSVKSNTSKVLLTSPRGKTFNQETASKLSKEEHLIFICGHYEGIDERVLEEIVTDEVSIGDYVLTGGELPAMVMIDAISRKVPGVLNNDLSSEIETFYDNLLEYPQYTRPETWHDKKVPDVLLSGHHGNIDKWRREKSLERTLAKRPELLEDANLTKKDKEYLEKIQ